MQSFNELGHLTPQFTIIYLLLNAFHTTHNTQNQYIYLFFVSFFDYALLGPSLKTFTYNMGLHSPRPLYPQLNGMPSGHTQLSWLIFTFFYLNNDNFNTYLFGILAIFTSYQRIYSGMHSQQQVFVGFLLGIILGYIWFYIYKLL
tara:strand:+ start:113 stop:547 length:435 start_codon:yes stop_codon:yes gene_type:complete